MHQLLLILVYERFDDNRGSGLLGSQRTSKLCQHIYTEHNVWWCWMFGLFFNSPTLHSISTVWYVHLQKKNITKPCLYPTYLIFRTYIATQPTSWIDDFKDWSETSGCCKYFYSNNSFCPHTQSNSLCGSCAISNLPNITWEEYFEKYLSYFLNDNPDTACAKGGHASYADVSLVKSFMLNF